jgi:hypothetical protein
MLIFYLLCIVDYLDLALTAEAPITNKHESGDYLSNPPIGARSKPEFAVQRMVTTKNQGYFSQ